MYKKIVLSVCFKLNLDVIGLRDINTLFCFGRLAQLVGISFTPGVKGSSPLLPTIVKLDFNFIK